MTMIYFNASKVARFKNYFKPDTYNSMMVQSAYTETRIVPMQLYDSYDKDLCLLDKVVVLSVYEGEFCIEISLYCNGEEHFTVIQVNRKDKEEDIISTINDYYYSVTGENIRQSTLDSSYTQYDLIIDNTKE